MIHQIKVYNAVTHPPENLKATKFKQKTPDVVCTQLSGSVNLLLLKLK